MSETATRRPGRPEIGGEVRVRLGGLLPLIDQMAATWHVTRAEAIRELLRRALQAELPPGPVTPE